MYHGAVGTPTQRVALTVRDEQAYLRLDAFVASQLPWRSRRSLVELLAAGAIAVNGRRVKKAHRLAPGDTVELLLPRAPEAALDLGTIELKILFEDDDLVVVDKPGDLAVHPASTCAHRNLLRRLEHHYRHERLDLRVQPSVIHRLDRTTSGVVAFAKHRELVSFYTNQFRQRTTTKEYLAIVHGSLAGSGRIELPIHLVPQRPVRVGPGGKPSRTDFRVLESSAGFSRLAITLHTGRKHQIRAHLAAQGNPLVHDDVYGAPSTGQSLPGARPLLHAQTLGIDHRNGRRLYFEALPPQDFTAAWTALTT